VSKQLIIIGIIALLVSVGLCGCTNNPLDTDKNKFVGTWKTDVSNTNGFVNYTDTYIFFSDGTISSTYMGSGSVNMPGSWELKDGKLILTVMIQKVYDYSFSNNDQTLTLTSINGDESRIFYK
jgi:hypothetical protein